MFPRPKPLPRSFLGSVEILLLWLRTLMYSSLISVTSLICYSLLHGGFASAGDWERYDKHWSTQIAVMRSSKSTPCRCISHPYCCAHPPIELYLYEKLLARTINSHDIWKWHHHRIHVIMLWIIMTHVIAMLIFMVQTCYIYWCVGAARPMPYQPWLVFAWI